MAIRSSREHQLRVLQHLTKSTGEYVASVDRQITFPQRIPLVAEVQPSAGAEPARRPRRARTPPRQTEIEGL